MSKRRSFLKTMAAVTAGLMVPFDHTTAASVAPSDRLGDLLPLRKFGNTGIRVTMLGIGGAHVGRSSEKLAQQLIEAALEGGIRFFDNAESYNSGGAETKYGKYLCPKYRDVAFIMTKTTARTGKQAQEHLEASLRRLKRKFRPVKSALKES